MTDDHTDHQAPDAAADEPAPAAADAADDEPGGPDAIVAVGSGAEASAAEVAAVGSGTEVGSGSGLEPWDEAGTTPARSSPGSPGSEWAWVDDPDAEVEGWQDEPRVVPAAADAGAPIALEPVAGPPAPPPVAGPGWYPDPARRTQLRWYDGAAWGASIVVDGRVLPDRVPTTEHPAPHPDARRTIGRTAAVTTRPRWPFVVAAAIFLTVLAALIIFSVVAGDNDAEKSREAALDPPVVTVAESVPVTTGVSRSTVLAVPPSTVAGVPAAPTAAPDAPTDPTPTTVAVPAVPADASVGTLTLDQYDQLVTGMTEAQVGAITGPCTPLTQSGAGAATVKVVTCKGTEAFTGATLTFSGGKLLSKAQTGLSGPAAERKGQMTLAKFEQLSTGISAPAAQAITGPCDTTSESNVAGVATFTLTCYDSTGLGNAVLLFSGGALSGKSQSGLQ